MSQKVVIFSKPMFDDTMLRNEITDLNVESDWGQYAFISIRCSTRNSESLNTNPFLCDIPHFKSNHKNVLNLIFDDIGTSIKEELPYLVLFDKEHAREILDFVEANSSSDFIVHCTAGISRSGAVGSFIRQMFDLDYEEFCKINSCIVPNQHIMKVLSEVYSERKSS